jgi:putative FmdB family regulatory protein
MPLYAYRCTACGAREEHIQKFSDPPIERCETCGGALEKELTGAAFHLKGGGWYKDGYASSKPGASSSEGGSSSSSSSDGGSSSSSSSSSGEGGGGSSTSADKPKPAKAASE